MQEVSNEWNLAKSRRGGLRCRWKATYLNIKLADQIRIFHVIDRRVNGVDD